MKSNSIILIVCTFSLVSVVLFRKENVLIDENCYVVFKQFKNNFTTPLALNIQQLLTALFFTVMQNNSFFFLALEYLVHRAQLHCTYTYYVRSYNNLVYLHKVVCLFKHFKFAWPIFLSSFDQGLNQQRILGNSGRHKQNAFWDALFLQQRIICEQFKENYYYTDIKIAKGIILCSTFKYAIE